MSTIVRSKKREHRFRSTLLHLKYYRLPATTINFQNEGVRRCRREYVLTADVMLKGLYVSPTSLHWLPVRLFVINKDASLVCRKGYGVKISTAFLMHTQ